jgi:hypothetical protein
MPIITVAMYSGRSQRDKDRLAEAIPEDVVNMLKVDKKRKTYQYRLRTELNSIILTKKKCVNDFYCPVTKDIYKNMV